MNFASRVTHLEPEGAYAVLARAQALEAQGKHIIHLEIGQPDFPTFPGVVDAGVSAIRNGRTRYNPPAGTPELRKAVAEDAGARRGIDIQPTQVVIGPGAKPGLFFPTLAVVQPGDEVLYPDPGFPTYRAMIQLAGGVPVPVPLREENDFSFDIEALEKLAGPKTRMIILNSPANPTGGVIPLADLERIASLAQRWNAWVMSDEIYARLVYSGDFAPSIASLPGMQERTIIVDGFSKTFAMTGWRLGYTIMPEALAERVELLLTHSVGCTATFTQDAGLAALQGPQDQVSAVLADYRQRRDRMVAGLNALPGVHCQVPGGAFYAFPNITQTGLSSRQLASRLLDEAGVAVLAGTDFGHNGEGYLRLCYAASPVQIDEGLARIAAFLNS